MTTHTQYEIAAYYFPQYHRDPRNDRWHGEGWTEWELMRQAQSRFPGHRQPIVPAWGYFDESDPAWAAREIDLAADHGITSFLYDWYWYEDGAFLNSALEKGFLRAPNTQRLKFALMWANHDWVNIHPANFVNRPETLAAGRISPAAFERMTDYIVEHLFSQPNYLTIHGAPYFSIYELGNFLSGMGGLDEASAALKRFREKTCAAGFPDLHLNAVVWGLTILPGESRLSNPVQVVETLSCSSITTYAWAHHYNFSGEGFPHIDYADVAQSNYRVWEDYRERFPLPYHPNVSMGWDPSPRTIQSDRYENRGYPWTGIMENNTPEAFQAALERAKAFVDRSQHIPRMITLNAWNEWTEGSYLLPDTLHGNGFVEAVRKVFGVHAPLVERA